MENHKSKIDKKKGACFSMKQACPAMRWGFSLVEVLVTLMVLSIGIAAVSALMIGNIKSSNNAKNQVIASELAQEGIELVRNLRDNHLTTSPKFDSGGACMLDGNDYRIGKNNPLVCPYNTVGGSAAALYVDAGNIGCTADISGFYNYTNACGATSRTKTKFYRKIQISNSISSKQVVVTSIVSWNGTGLPLGLVDSSYCTVGNKCISIVSVLPDPSN